MHKKKTTSLVLHVFILSTNDDKNVTFLSVLSFMCELNESSVVVRIFYEEVVD